MWAEWQTTAQMAFQEKHALDWQHSSVIACEQGHELTSCMYEDDAETFLKFATILKIIPV